jgi:hypothetical protein
MLPLPAAVVPRQRRVDLRDPRRISMSPWGDPALSNSIRGRPSAHVQPEDRFLGNDANAGALEAQ